MARGTCPACGERIGLMWANPIRQDELVMAAHYRPFTKFDPAAEIVCGGYRNPPLEIVEPEEAAHS